MIKELYIENFAIIEKTSVSFEEGLNIITGETGAGKSIVVKALELILGSRADKNFIGIYSDRSIVEATIEINDDFINVLRENYSISTDKYLIITREIYLDSSSVARINNRHVKLSLLQAIMKELVNSHGQNETFILNDSKNYIDIIDAFSNGKASKYRQDLSTLLDEKSNLVNKIKSLDIDESEIEREIDVLSYQIKEIEDSNIESIDLDELNDEYKVLTNANEIIESLAIVLDNYSSDGYKQSDISTRLSNSVQELGKISSYDKKIQDFQNELESISYSYQSLFEDIYNFMSNIDFDEERIQYIDFTYKQIEDLKRKYGSTIDSILSYYYNAKEKLKFYEDREENIHHYKENVLKLDKRIKNTADSLTDIRQEISKKLEEDILEELKTLNFPRAKFAIDLSNKDTIDKTGQDKVEFLVSFNLGQDIKPLSLVGSGGEISRFMLALKIVVADYDNIKVLIFDEIDAGISGITAGKVGQALKNLSNNYQVVAITHLSQIAIKADNHIVIDKYIDQGLSKSRLRKIDNEDRVNEIARLIAGDSVTEKTIETAKEQLDNQK